MSGFLSPRPFLFYSKMAVHLESRGREYLVMWQLDWILCGRGRQAMEGLGVGIDVFHGLRFTNLSVDF